MKNTVDLDFNERQKLLQHFYEYFQDGYQFEEFLKYYLEIFGLDEVVVTQRSRDGGIDLKAIRKGLGGFSETDSISYYVQAKKNKPNKSISVRNIRELKGTIPFGHKGIFITTAKFSRDSIKESNNDLSKPIILIDGKALIDSCIEKEIGFSYKPIFSKSIMDKILQNTGIVDSVEKQITANDIRAYILPIPRDIINKIPENLTKLKVSFNGGEFKQYNIDNGRRYLGGIAQIYRQYGLRTEDNIIIPKKAKWNIADDNKITIII